MSRVFSVKWGFIPKISLFLTEKWGKFHEFTPFFVFTKRSEILQTF